MATTITFDSCDRAFWFLAGSGYKQESVILGREVWVNPPHRVTITRNPDGTWAGRFDEVPPPSSARTVPEKPVPWRRFMRETTDGLWDVYDWVRGDGGTPAAECVAADLTEADARLLVFGGELKRLAGLLARDQPPWPGPAKCALTTLGELKDILNQLEG